MRRLVMALLVLSLLAVSALWFEFGRFQRQPLSLSQERVLEIARGSTLNGLARDLAARGEIVSAWHLMALARLSYPGLAIKAGAYRLEPGMTPVQLLDKLGRGEVIQYRISLIEGRSFQQWRQSLQQHPHLQQSLSSLSDSELMAKLGRAGQSPEGRFFPDTYVFGYQATDLSVLQQAMAAMDKKLAYHWLQRDSNLPYQHADQALVMASIIEKESGVAAELPKIAGVFVRRLKLGMKLQTDPTVIYGLGSGFDGNLRKADLLRPSPYNTYLNYGLPPTPICMPAEAAIRAALHPDQGKALYFVADGKGGHQFSDTLDQHNAAVRQYLKHLKESP